MLAAEKAHRAHAIVEQVIADLKNGPLAHLPSGHFWANSAWLVCAAIAFNLTRAAGTLASAFHANATTGTIRTQLIAVPGWLARSARRLTLHLPTAWPWQRAWEQLSAAANSPPLAAPPTRPSDRTYRDDIVETSKPACRSSTPSPSPRQDHHPCKIAKSWTVDPG